MYQYFNTIPNRAWPCYCSCYMSFSQQFRHVFCAQLSLLSSLMCAQLPTSISKWKLLSEVLLFFSVLDFKFTSSILHRLISLSLTHCHYQRFGEPGFLFSPLYLFLSPHFLDLSPSYNFFFLLLLLPENCLNSSSPFSFLSSLPPFFISLLMPSRTPLESFAVQHSIKLLLCVTFFVWYTWTLFSSFVTDPPHYVSNAIFATLFVLFSLRCAIMSIVVRFCTLSIFPLDFCVLSLYNVLSFPVKDCIL